MKSITEKKSYLLILPLALFFLYGHSLAEEIPEYNFPQKINPVSNYLFFIHNYYVEINGPSKGCNYYGILASFKSRDFTVISEIRTKPIAPEKYARKIAEQTRTLLNAGVPPENIIISGHSKGGYIALHAAHILQHPEINYAIFAGCNISVLPETPLPLQGRFLSIRDTTDTVADSCQNIFSNLSNGIDFEELTLNTGKGHKLFFLPDNVWIDPIVEWMEKLKID